MTIQSANPTESLLATPFSELTVVPSPRQLLDQYFDVRLQVLDLDLAHDEALQTIQDATKQWAEENPELGIGMPFSKDDYLVPSYSKLRTRYNALETFLKTNFPQKVHEEEYEASRLFIESAFGMYAETPGDGSVSPEADGSFAFVVPTRVSRKNVEYGKEVETIMPILRYLPNEMRVSLAIGLPPTVMDTYTSDGSEKKGYLVLAPIFTDMMEDLPLGDALEVAIAQVNRTVDFAYSQLGAKVQGLGAIIPALTRYGAHIDNKNVITTTGHGGTIQLIMNTLERAVREDYVTAEQLQKIGVLGLGAIGHSIAEIVRHNFPNSDLRVYDIRHERAEKIAPTIGAVVCQNEAEVIRDSEIIISAVTTPIDVEAIGLGPKDLKDKLIIDDSQPGSFSPAQVQKLGGTLAWVIGANGIKRSSYDFGGSMANRTAEIFGCEAEAATLAAYYFRLQEVDGMTEGQAAEALKEIALRSAVTPEKVERIADIFSLYNVHAAPLQAFGRYLRDEQ